MNPGWINLPEQMDEWREIVTLGMKIFFPQRVDKFPTSSAKTNDNIKIALKETR
jgi:hypothetical protein